MVDNGFTQVLVLLLIAPPSLVGAVLGLLSAFLPLFGKPRSTRICLSLLAALAGGGLGAILAFGAMSWP